MSMPRNDANFGIGTLAARKWLAIKHTRTVPSYRTAGRALFRSLGSDPRRRGSPSFPTSTFRADGLQFLQLPHDGRLDQRAIACARAASSELGQQLLLLASTPP